MQKARNKGEKFFIGTMDDDDPDAAFVKMGMDISGDGNAESAHFRMERLRKLLPDIPHLRNRSDLQETRHDRRRVRRLGPALRASR